MESETRIPIQSETDIVTARASGRSLATELGFTGTDATVIATAISEVARNIVEYSPGGEILLGRLHSNGHEGLLVVARDEGPGIADIEQAMQPGYTTASSLGLGLPGARRLVDEFEITSEVGKGTTVTMKKWNR